MCSDTDVLLLLLHYFERISTSTIFKTTEHEYTLRKTHENLTPDICKALHGFHALSGCDQTVKYPGFSQKIVLWYLCESIKWIIRVVNQSGFIRHVFSSRYKITRDFRHITRALLEFILKIHDTCKYPRFASFKVAQGLLPLTCEPFRQKVLRRLLFIANHLIFFYRCCQIQETIAGNGMVLNHCSKLFPPHTLRLHKQ